VGIECGLLWRLSLQVLRNAMDARGDEIEDFCGRVLRERMLDLRGFVLCDFFCSVLQVRMRR
jgi:hypothetical protein